VNVELSSEVLAKAKSLESPFYRKQRRKASKKTHHFFNQRLLGVDLLLLKMPVWLGPMALTRRRRRYQAARPHLICQRVEPPSVAAATYGAPKENAFHQLELPAVFPFR
jgi:hypothetical protein